MLMDRIGEGRKRGIKNDPYFPTGASAWVVAPVGLERGGKFYGKAHTSCVGYVHIEVSGERSRGQAAGQMTLQLGGTI